MKEENMIKKIKKGRKKMAVLTADCDRTFVVAPDKVKEFKNKKRNTEALKKAEGARKKLKNLKVEE